MPYCFYQYITYYFLLNLNMSFILFYSCFSIRIALHIAMV